MKYLILLLLTTTAVFAQSEISYKGETINKIDENGNKTGIWKIFDEANGIEVHFVYKNGERVEDTKYYKNGTLMLAFDLERNLVLYKDGKTVKAYYSRDDNDGTTQVPMEDGTAVPQDILDYLIPFNTLHPMYYGGIKELTKYIADNIDHSKIKSVVGKTTVLFTLDRNGFIAVDEIKGTDNPQYIEEVKKVLAQAPRWQPGYQVGGFVKCSFSLPLTLK